MMVRAMHAAGIEVILDVVYNHTAEGNQMGPTLSWRGIDNAAYYRLSPEDPRYYMDFTGCGNTLNMQHPKVLQLIMDSLRYWVTEMHVDGFRFDLASTLARELFEVNKLGAFFDIIHQDPILTRVKLIAEPWDVGPGGYQVGNFPPGWTEWNGKYRDNVRRFWKGDGGTASEFATRLCGSRDLYEWSGRKPYASDQLRHLPRRVHAAGPGQLQREAQRGQRRGEPRRGGQQRLLELRRRGADRRPEHQRPARAAEAELHRHADALAGRADAPGRRRAEPHPERQQQHLLPGQRAELARLEPGRAASRSSWSSSSRSTRIWQEQPVLQRRKFFQGRSIRGRGHQGHLLVQPDRQGDDRRGLGRARPVPRHAAGRRPDRRGGRARRADRRRHAAGPAERPPRADPVHAAGDEPGPPVGAAVRHGRRRGRPGAVRRPATSTRCGTGRWPCSGRCRSRRRSRGSPRCRRRRSRREAATRRPRLPAGARSGRAGDRSNGT